MGRSLGTSSLRTRCKLSYIYSCSSGLCYVCKLADPVRGLCSVLFISYCCFLLYLFSNCCFNCASKLLAARLFSDLILPKSVVFCFSQFADYQAVLGMRLVLEWLSRPGNEVGAGMVTEAWE